ncbi:uncharacterized protein DSM5745_03027 [Aspergillus mulundensis]|uniref:Uncharacterized protein n=1 Tax=Aspergillus mulundensis TaxID=1810919 RepID=A0A3D8SJ68_9EURO|nr:hypothetical protein DSM5745_03027 [Aspergillus mulundensis]RDW86385.1 hypothetical protein DSM5745_03027 [Aspergillus mulundensis]
MTSLLRSTRSIRAVNPTTSRFPVFLQQRFNGQSSYGNGETKSEDDRNAPTRDMEHPGAPPPDVGKENPSKSQPSYKQDKSRKNVLEEDIPNRPSNNAKPTIRQSSNVDDDGNVKANVPDDVKKHNEEIDQRHDKPYNRIHDDGKVGKGFWGKLDGAEGY